VQFLLFKEEKFYALCTLKDKNFAPKQNERDCPMTPQVLESAKQADSETFSFALLLICY
jgi:hypothetical protein